ncbi:positive regulation of cilium movement [Tritrichomonas musculus]|uniref:Positive regulation of cilium movement n=1 Tax=Tritrichomonas musculus TaxID=1915356 RepID=A0ABR2HJX1_9EUKA
MSIPKGTLFDTHKVRFNVVKSALKEIECTQTDSDKNARIIWWDGYMQRDQLLNMYPHQRINRIPGMDLVCYKSNTFMAMNRLRKMNHDLFNFFPLTYILPSEFSQFKADADKLLSKSETLNEDKPTWIFKPRSGQCGIGIQLFQDPSTVADSQKYNGIVQSYIAPHLFDGVKFDLRLYLFVSTIKPYTVYLYREGLSRFCTEPYVKPNSENMNDLFMHLTNTSVNIKNQNAARSSYIQFASPVLNKLNKPDLWKKIKRVAALSMIAQYHQIIENIEQEEVILLASNEHFKAALNYNPKKNDEEEEDKDIVDLPPIDKLHRYFHLAGIDILINDKYEPILLEMNDRPSMFVSFEEIERELKKNLVKEALSLISLDGSPVNKDTFGKWDKILPDPEDKEFNKMAQEIMEKSLKKPISEINAVKIVKQQPNTKDTKIKNPPLATQSQVVKKASQPEKLTTAQPKKIQNDQTVIYQLPNPLHTNDQALKKVIKADQTSSSQIPKKTAQTEQINKEVKIRKTVQQEKKEDHIQQNHPKTVEKTIPSHTTISTENSYHTQISKSKPRNTSPEKAMIRSSHSSKNNHGKDLKIGSSTYADDKTIRRSHDRFEISSDYSPIAKRPKNLTQTTKPKQIASKHKAPPHGKIETTSSTNSVDTLPPLSQNKELSKTGVNKERSTLSNLPGINQFNCQ